MKVIFTQPFAKYPFVILMIIGLGLLPFSSAVISLFLIAGLWIVIYATVIRQFPVLNDFRTCRTSIQSTMCAWGLDVFQALVIFGLLVALCTVLRSYGVVFSDGDMADFSAGVGFFLWFLMALLWSFIWGVVFMSALLLLWLQQRNAKNT